MSAQTVHLAPHFTLHRGAATAPIHHVAASAAEGRDPDQTVFSPAATRVEECPRGSNHFLRKAGRALLFTGLGVVGLAALAVGAVEVSEAVVVTQQATVHMACEKDASTFPPGFCGNWFLPGPATPPAHL